MAKVNEVVYQISLKDLLSSNLSKAEGNVKNFEGEVDDAIIKVGQLNNAMSGSHAGSFMQTTGAVALGTLLTRGVEMAGNEAVRQVKSILSAGLDAGKIRAEFSVLTGGKEMGDALFGDLNKYISESIFGTELFGSAKTLLAYGVSAKQIMPDLKMLGDIAMGDSEKMKSLTLAFGQTMAAGKLQGDDLRQYIATGFNPLKEIERTTGKSYATLKKLMEDGSISAKMVHEAFVSATSSGGLFFGMLDKIGQTPFGKLQAMQGNIEMAKQQLGEALLPAMSDFMDASKPLIDALPGMFEALKPTMEGVIHTFADLATWVSKNGDTVGAMAKGVKLLVEGFLLWKAGTVALTAANWLWTASIGAQAAATAQTVTTTTAVNAALTTEAELVGALAVEYDALAVSMTAADIIAAQSVGARYAAAAAAGLPINMAGAAAAATAGSRSLATNFAAGAASAAIPVAIAYFAGEALSQMISTSPLTGEGWSFMKVMKAAGSGDSFKSADLMFSISKTFGFDPIQDAIDKSNEKNRKPQMDLDDVLAGRWNEKKEEVNPYFPNVKTAAKSSSTTSETKATDSLQADVSKVTGQQVKNTYVTINGGLIHDFTVKTTTLKEATPDIKRLVVQAVTDAINDSELNN